ncbi:MAG: outer membrane lipoprotein-sorting protein [Treponemataceae bacterium]
MKKIVLIGAFLVVQTAVLFAQNADEIVKASRDRIKSDTVSTRSRMVIYAKDGSTTERLLDQYSIDTKSGTRTVIVFQKPASVAGTRFLTVENKGKSGDRWIFLPSLGKIRRISSGESSGSFMGTDFSYDDVSFSDRDYTDDTHTFLREETLDGKACWVIESTPKDTTFPYSKIISWIDKSNSVSVRVHLFDKKGELSKQLDIGKLETIQGRLTPMGMKMTSVQAKTSTEVKVEIMKYNDKIPESVFTTRFLETGRP